MQDRIDEFEAKGARIVAISSDAASDGAALAKKLDLTPDEVPLASDPDRRVIELYRVDDDRKEISLPATFVVGKDGRIKYVYVRRRAPDRPEVDSVLAALPES